MDRKLTGKGVRVRDRMIQETAKIIREEGFRYATVRTIAERAGVNIASIRYYFGSKDELISEAIEYLMNRFEDLAHYLDLPNMSVEDRLYQFMSHYFRLANIHPALYRSISYMQTETQQNTYFIYVNLLHDRCWRPVMANLAEYTKTDNEDILNMKTMFLFSALEYPLLLQSNNPHVQGVKFIQEKQVDRYIRQLLSALKG